jgi:hypothetical protein
MVSPGEIWGKQHGDLCERFIETARSHNFKRAYKFTTLGGKAIRAYGIGGSEYRLDPEAVFLCEDKTLRSSEHSLGKFSNPPYGYMRGKGARLSNGVIEASPGYFSHETRSTIVGYNHEWGTFLGERVHESQVNPWQREWFFAQPEPIMGREVIGMKFHEASIEDLIAVHEAAITLVRGETDVTAPNRHLFSALYGDLKLK